MTKPQSRTRVARTELGWIFGLFALLFMAMALNACNTVEGMGEDVSAAGGAMSDSAEDVEDKM